ncbi:apolipoprotein N-acyltransferase [Crenobacter caeni]|uniref:Apolipoprotein N-acyltransferase n=1 Tax=Crenobacter caeni TaxID=2705474 RepID=A0A6B2KMY8_9NEIS|nr:apolipoprotein N-acyltransferase [Crenobacter caeni]NDV11534.1 apolipoprotein N-acyltransferase [Crenobacter caeni]
MRAPLYWTLVVASGAAALFAFAPYRLFWLMPLLLAVPLALSAREGAHPFLTGYLWGLAAYTACFNWIYHSLHTVAGLPSLPAAAATLLLPAYLALFPATAIALSRRLARGRLLLAHLVLFPALWTLAEWLRSWFLTGFPWGAVGYSQITESPLAGYAAVGGIHAVTFLVALSAGVLAQLPVSNMRGRFAMAALVAAVWGGGAALSGVSWTQPVGKPTRVALAQGNIPQSLKWNPDIQQLTLERYFRMIATARADLLILPETAIPLFLDDLPSGVITMIQREAHAKKMAVAAGIPRRTDDGQGYLNAVVAFSDERLPYYAKDHLVPFGEFIPLPSLIGWIYRYMNMPLSGFSRGGSAQAPLALAGQQVAFNVCYEDSFGEELIGPARDATLLANVSNLAWFGDSVAMDQHLQLSQARSLETGRPMLRSTNTGMTALIEADGTVKALAAPNTTQVLNVTVTGRSGLTPYMRTGNLPVLLLCALLLVAGSLWARRTR